MKLYTLVIASALFINLIHADIDNENYEVEFGGSTLSG